MSRTTPHCACRNSQPNVDENAKIDSNAYSLLPNYTYKSENHRQSTKVAANVENNSVSYSKSKYQCSNRNETDLKNYENIEYYSSGLFRPHSCPAEEKNEITDKNQSPETDLKNSKTYQPNNPNKHRDHFKQSDKYQRKYSRSKLDPKSLNINNLKPDDESPPVDKQYSDSKYLDYNSGLSLYVKNSRIPIPYTGTVDKKNHVDRSLYNDTHLLANDIKKSSCGLKYIIFQKLSIMTHLITGSKSKKPSLISKHSNLSDDNIFKDKSPHTKRSKSYHLLDGHHSRTCNRCENNCKSNSVRRLSKTRSTKNRLSNASNSSSGSIDAHAGSPITIMTTVCGNILANGSNPLVSNTFCHSSKTKWKNEEKPVDQSQEVKEVYQQRNNNQHRNGFSNYQTTKSKFEPHSNFSSSHHSCSNCSCTSQPPCIRMSCEPICAHQCCSKSHIQSPLPPPPPQPCHYCCCNHSHVLMHPSYSQSPYMCCNSSNFLHHCSIAKPLCLHSFFPCNQPMFCNESNCTASSVLCGTCQAKNVDRCHSAHLMNGNRGFMNNTAKSSAQNYYSSSQKYRSKPDSRIRNYRHSPIGHSKTTSIPPPPPPPPSSLYSTKEMLVYKPKQKRHKSSNNGKICTRCSEKIPGVGHDNSDNVQNIIYSHPNNTIACESVKAHKTNDVFHHNKNPCDNKWRSLTKNISWNSANEKEGDHSPIDDHHHSYEHHTQDRRSADIYRRRSSAVTPVNSSQKQRFISKTPESYKSKYDNRQKNSHSESKRILKHKSVCTTREYNFIDGEGLCRNDSVDSPEAGSFIYSPVSPIMKKTSPAVAISNLSSFNIHQQHFSHKDNRNSNNINNNNNPESARKAFQENMLSLREVGWYWGPLSFTEAERLMENKANGTFLVRDSGHDTYFLSLTFRVRETTYHTRIEYSQGTFSFWSQPESHSATTISEFIDKAVAHSQSGKFHYFLLTNVPGQPPMEVSLLYPLTRNQIVHSLKHLSRFIILSNIRKDHITNLNIPSPLKLYLLEKQYYISNFDQFIESTMDAHPLSYKPSIINEPLDK